MLKATYNPQTNPPQNHGEESVVPHSGDTFYALESLVGALEILNKPKSHLCENEQVWNGGDPSGQDATLCNAPNARFYEWKDGLIPHEAFLCDSCAKSLGVR